MSKDDDNKVDIVGCQYFHKMPWSQQMHGVLAFYTDLNTPGN